VMIPQIDTNSAPYYQSNYLSTDFHVSDIRKWSKSQGLRLSAGTLARVSTLQHTRGSYAVCVLSSRQACAAFLSVYICPYTFKVGSLQVRLVDPGLGKEDTDSFLWRQRIMFATTAGLVSRR
jgi:hypothetical protein